MGRRNLPKQEEEAPVERPQKQPGKKKMLNSGESDVVSGVSVSWFNVLNEAEDSRDDEKEDEFTDAVEIENLNVSTSIVAIDASAVESKGSKEVTESSKTKKKNKKRGGRTANKDDDLEKLLAEVPPISKAVQVPDSTLLRRKLSALNEATDDDKIEDEAVELAAAKKRKKKKEKEKEKKTVTAAMAEAREERHEEPKIETKSKGTEKKLPRHVREKQEVLMRRKEAEEKKKREEEERIKEEEEERLRQEELERQAEEAKRKKKERKKENLRKKKEEGMLLTRRQKDEQHRLEARRNQLLASKGVSVSAGEDGPSPKRPVYTSKKLKSHQTHANDATMLDVDIGNREGEGSKVESVANIKSLEIVMFERGDGVIAEEEEEVEASSEKNDDGVEKQEKEEDDVEWDEKSWDEMDIALPVKPAFDGEEAEPEAGPIDIEETQRTDLPSVGDGFPLTGASKQVTSLKKSSDPTNVNVTVRKQPRTKVLSINKIKGKCSASKKEQQSSDSVSSESSVNLRSPICCVMGHVDAGKTMLLDCIRGTEVQKGEAGGITQQIGATYLPAVNIRERTKELKADAKLLVPGLLVIDTPGHESFTNLRSRGSGLCDIAIVVVDITAGLKPQTIESINLLKTRKIEFIVALNKVDRLYGWKKCPNSPFIKSIKEQSAQVVELFTSMVQKIIGKFMEQGLNTALYYRNKGIGGTVSIVPTSAISGEGIPDLLLLLVQWAQKTMVEKLTFNNEVQCTVLEVKVTEGYGTTVDAILVNGVLHEGDQIVVRGMQGPIVTTIRALLTPHPMRELRVKGSYLHHKEIKAAQGIKIAAQDLDHAIVGSSLFVVEPDDDVESIKDLAMEDMESIKSLVDKRKEGVHVQASTLGSLEALLEYLKSPAVNIPVRGVSIGPVHKKDVKKADVMLQKKAEYASILAFDVEVTPDAREHAEKAGVRIFKADTIYNLVNQFIKYINDLKEERKKEAAKEAIFPCVLRILPDCVFKTKDPILLGVHVVAGIAKVGTPICAPRKGSIYIGRIESIYDNNKSLETAKKGDKVSIKIVVGPGEQQKMHGRHFDSKDELVSQISRRSIEILEAYFQDDLGDEDRRLVMALKKCLGIY